MKPRRSTYLLLGWLFWVVGVPCVLLLAGIVATALAKADALHFDGAHLWWVLAATPFAGAIALWGAWRKRRSLDRFTSAQLAPLLAPGFSTPKSIAKAALKVIAVLLIAIAIVGPRWGMYLEKQKAFGVDIVVVVDVSRSMLARDVDPNRLERAKLELRQQLTERGVFKSGSRLALLAFAGSTSLKLPLTTDHIAFRNKLDSLDTSSAPRGGTAIAEAIRAAAELFSNSPPEATRIIVLLTDGEDHVGGPVEAAEAANKEFGVNVYCIGVGDPGRTAGAEVPGPTGRPLLKDGQIVFSKLDPDSLRKISGAGSGGYAGIDEFPRIVNRIAGMKKTELSVEERLRHRPQYQWFLAAALLLLMLDTMLPEVRRQTTDVPTRTWQIEGL